MTTPIDEMLTNLIEKLHSGRYSDFSPREFPADLHQVALVLEDTRRTISGPKPKHVDVMPIDDIIAGLVDRIGRLEGRAADHSLSNTVAGMKYRLDELESKLETDAPDPTDEPEPAPGVDWERKYHEAVNYAGKRVYAKIERELGAALGGAESIGWAQMLGRVRDQRNRISELEALNANQERTIKGLRDSVLAHAAELVKVLKDGARFAVQRDAAERTFLDQAVQIATLRKEVKRLVELGGDHLGDAALAALTGAT